MSAVLPIALADTGRPGSDIDRLGLLLTSLASCARPGAFDQLIVVTRPDDLTRVKEEVRRLTTIPSVVIDERDVCPVLASDPASSDAWPAPNKGWYRQQLIKLAIHRHLSTPFYMTLDSDVVFVRAFSADDLIIDGKASVNVQRQSDYEQMWTPAVAADGIACHHDRHERSSRLLGLPRRNQRYFFGETPVILSTSIVGALVQHLDSRTTSGDWQSFLLQNTPWTEYNLYFSFAEWAGVFSEYHRHGHADTVLRLTDSLWLPSECYLDGRDLASWSPAASEAREGVALVVQSYLGYPADQVIVQLRRLFPAVFRSL